MATDLEAFRDHCRAMATGRQHRADCPAILRKLPWAKTPPGDGCVPAADRALFGRLANEIDAYLTPDDAPLWEDATP